MEHRAMKKSAIATLLLMAALMLSACGAADMNRMQADKAIDGMCEKKCRTAYPNWETWPYKRYRPDQFFACAAVADEAQKPAKMKASTNKESAPPALAPVTLLPTQYLLRKQFDDLYRANESAVQRLSPQRVASLASNPAFRNCLQKIDEAAIAEMKRRCAGHWLVKGKREGTPEYKKGFDSCLKLKVSASDREINGALGVDGIIKTAWTYPCNKDCARSEEAVKIAEQYGLFGGEEWGAFLEGWENGDKTKAGHFFDQLIEENFNAITESQDDGETHFLADLGHIFVAGVSIFGSAVNDKIVALTRAGEKRDYLILRDQDLQALTTEMEKNNARQQREVAALNERVAQCQKDLAAAQADKARQQEAEKRREEILKQLRMRYEGLQGQLNDRQAQEAALAEAGQKQQLQKQYDVLNRDVQTLAKLIETLDKRA